MKPTLHPEILRQVVFEQQEEAAHIQTLPLVERDKTQALKAMLHQPLVKIITGARRCGKSMLGHQALKGLSYGYLNFDDERLIGLTASDLITLLQCLLELKPDAKIFLLDEVQNVDSWELGISQLQQEGYNFVITGSNSKLLSKELPTHLPGQHVILELTPFSFREVLRAKQFSWSKESLYRTRDRAILFRHLEEYLHQGGLPDMVITGYTGIYLRNLYDTIIARDITYRYGIRYSSTLKEMAVYSHTNLGCRLTFLKTKNIFEIGSIYTVKKYFQYLTDAYLVFLLRAFSYKFKEQVKQPRKSYTIDNGLSAAISPKFSRDRGSAIENLVFQELLRRGISCAYYATPDEEVDFVTYKNREVTALIQVTVSLEDPSVRKREIKALVKAASQLKCKTLLLITWEEEELCTVNDYTIIVIPLWKWLLEINTISNK